MMASLEHGAGSPRETISLGETLGRLLRGGDFVALTGPLGAGKTQLVKGIAAGLEVGADEPVVSPTFVLVREYVGRLTLYHIDAYRLNHTEELLQLGLDEMVAQPDAVVALEWADRAPGAVPEHACRIELQHVRLDRRLVQIRWSDRTRLASLSSRLQAK